MTNTQRHAVKLNTRGKSEISRRIERSDMRDWDRQYRFLVGPITQTPDCTCDWEHIENFYGEILRACQTRQDDDCPDHQ